MGFASPAAALEQKLTASDGAAEDRLGEWSVAVDGDTLVVGAHSKNNATGAAYVFQRVGDSWTQTAKLTASDGASGDNFGNSVAIDGDTIVVGAPLDWAGTTSFFRGSVYTFARTGAAARTETAKLTASDGASGDFLGWSVAIDGDTIVAGATADDIAANANQGSVYTFARTGAAARTETGKLTASEGASGDGLGTSVAIDGDTIVAGARPAAVGANANQGSAYTFARTGAAARTETAKLTASDGAAGDELGISVAIDGDTIVAGAHEDDIGANAGQGSAYTFARTGAAARTETAKLTASDGAARDELGWSVAIDGDTIVAGAYADSTGGNFNRGSVYTFARTGAAARSETGKLTPSDGAPGDGNFGSSVAIDGDTIAAGAPYDDIGANANQGSVSVFFSPADFDDDGVPDVDDDCPTGAASGLDTDGDGCEDTGEDPDDDNDTRADGSDSCATGETGWTSNGTTDRDSDGCRDSTEDSDDDADGKADGSDSCAAGDAGWTSNGTTDRDSDGCRDSTEDTDDDNDGKADGSDSCAAGELSWTSNGTSDNDSDGCRDSTEDLNDDNDPVADASDECRTIAASTASGCPAVSRTLTLSYSAKKRKFKGKLTATEPSCVDEDLVTVWKKRSGDDAQIGADEVNAEGRYVVSKRGRPGRYYATVDARVVTDVAACEPATSPTLRRR